MPMLTHTGHAHVHVAGIVMVLAINMVSLSLSQCCTRGHAFVDTYGHPCTLHRNRYRIRAEEDNKGEARNGNHGGNKGMARNTPTGEACERFGTAGIM